MAVVLKPDIIVASIIKRLYNFYTFIAESKGLTQDELREHENYQGYCFSLEDCIEIQRKARYSALGIVIADTEESGFRNFLENKRMFKPIGVDSYRLTEEVEVACFTGQIYEVIDTVLEHAYSNKTLLALDIL